MLKFRTMWDPGGVPARRFAIESVSGFVPVSKLAVDDRVKSRFAAFCRRHSLDELPQLYHVIRGEMSFVGPRPITQEEIHDYYGGIERRDPLGAARADRSLAGKGPQPPELRKKKTAGPAAGASRLRGPLPRDTPALHPQAS